MKNHHSSFFFRTALAFSTIALIAGCSSVHIDPDAREAAAKKWADELAAFDAADAKSPPQPGGLLLVGSSSFRKWTNAAESFPEKHVTNRGFGGSQMHELLALTDRLVWPYEPSEILVYEGDNDIAAKKEPAQIAKEFREFAQLVHRHLPKAKIYFVAIKPSPSRVKLMPQAAEANKMVADYCATKSWLNYIDVVSAMLDANGKPRPEIFVSDNLHMNGKGYELWTKIVRRALGLN